MALVISGKTACAISGRIITERDRVLCLPPFLAPPNEPASKCSDACVLRDYFEKWDFRDSVIELTKEFWVQQYRTSEAFKVIYEDGEYLIVKGTVEAKTRMLFLKHVFVLDVPQTMWRDFCKQLREIKDRVDIFPYSTIALHFSISERTNKMELRLETRGSGWDCIELSLSEWSRFQSALSVSDQS